MAMGTILGVPLLGGSGLSAVSIASTWWVIGANRTGGTFGWWTALILARSSSYGSSPLFASSNAALLWGGCRNAGGRRRTITTSSTGGSRRLTTRAAGATEGGDPSEFIPPGSHEDLMNARRSAERERPLAELEGWSSQASRGLPVKLGLRGAGSPDARSDHAVALVERILSDDESRRSATACPSGHCRYQGPLPNPRLSHRGPQTATPRGVRHQPRSPSQIVNLWLQPDGCALRFMTPSGDQASPADSSRSSPWRCHHAATRSRSIRPQ